MLKPPDLYGKNSKIIHPMGKDISKFVLITSMFFMNSVSNIRINYNVISLIETLVEAMFKIPNVVTFNGEYFLLGEEPFDVGF